MTTVEDKTRVKTSLQIRPGLNRDHGTEMPAHPVRVFLEDKEEEQERPFFKRYGLAIVIIVVTGIAIVLTLKMIAGSAAASRKAPALVIVSLPPPPPPPPVQTPPPEVVQDQQTFLPEEKPENEPPKPPDEPPIGTNIKGDGSANAFNLSNSGGNGLGNRDSNATRFGWYAGQVQSTVSEALRENRKTRAAELTVRVRIWPNENGRVARAQLGGSTGDPTLDAAIRDEVLTGLQLREPPPAGMPLPIVLRLSAKRPR